MSRPFDIVTFDCYGTLVDWEAGIGDWFVESAAGDGVRLDRRAALESYARHEAAVEAVLTAGKRKLSLVDCVSFQVLRQLGVQAVFCFDEHFREQGFEVIP